MIESSLGSAVIDSPLGSSMFFFHHVAIFLSNRATIFLPKTGVLFYIIIFSKAISLACFHNFNKTDSEKKNKGIPI